MPLFPTICPYYTTRRTGLQAGYDTNNQRNRACRNELRAAAAGLGGHGSAAVSEERALRMRRAPTGDVPTRKTRSGTTQEPFPAENARDRQSLLSCAPGSTVFPCAGNALDRELRREGNALRLPFPPDHKHSDAASDDRWRQRDLNRDGTTIELQLM